MVGDHVRITLDPDGDGLNARGDGVLSLAEVEVLGKRPLLEGNPNLALWLDANDIDGDGAPDTFSDGDRINTWTDKSGNGHGATNGNGGGSDPTYVASSDQGSGMPAVHFDGNDQMVTNFNFDTLGADFTIVTVSRYAGNQGDAGAYERLISSRQPQLALRIPRSEHRAFLRGRLARGQPECGQRPQRRPHYRGRCFPHPLRYLRTSTNGNPADPGVDIYKDGVQLANNATGGHNTVYKPGQLSLGAWTNNGQEASVGEVAEVLIFDGALSSSELKMVESYLDAKYQGNDQATVSIEVNGINDGPDGRDDHFEISEDHGLLSGDASPAIDLLNLDALATGDHTITAGRANL